MYECVEQGNAVYGFHKFTEGPAGRKFTAWSNKLWQFMIHNKKYRMYKKIVIYNRV